MQSWLLRVPATPKAEIPYTQHADLNASLCYPCFWTPNSPYYIFFLRKSAWTLESDGWIQNFTIRVVKIWIQLSDFHSHQYPHWVIHFVTFGNHICSRIMESHSYVYMFSIFCCIRIRILHIWNLSLTHRLFKWRCRLKAVFIVVYWLCDLGFLEFYLYSESENGYG